MNEHYAETNAILHVTC